MAVAPYYEYKPFENDTITSSSRIVLPSGLGNCNQITVRVVSLTCSGGADTLDFDLDTSYTRDAAQADEWIEIISMTQITAGTTETKYFVRSATQSWTDRLSLEVTCGAGATATGVSVTIIGANA